MTKGLSEERLDLVISYILISGVAVSVAVETIGIQSYYSSNGSLEIVFQPQYSLTGTDFFAYFGTLLSGMLSLNWNPLQVLGLGIVLLMITPYIRVAASVIYFAAAKNSKYFIITLFVLLVLTTSLLVH